VVVGDFELTVVGEIQDAVIGSGTARAFSCASIPIRFGRSNHNPVSAELLKYIAVRPAAQFPTVAILRKPWLPREVLH
jgi:hypothetical protein